METLYCKLVIILVVYAITSEQSPLTANEDDTTNDYSASIAEHLINREDKKDIFVSRGWGASGMPFSVLYMQPPNPKTKPRNMEKPMALALKHERPKNIHQVRKSINNKSREISVDGGMVVPQLFVSYGWGPLGK